MDSSREHARVNLPRVPGTILASLATALGLAALVCCLPDNPYQRFQLVDGTLFEPLRRGYERIHFDPAPVDVAIIGPSKTLLGLSAARVEQGLVRAGQPAHVANFSVPAPGRNVEWLMLHELYQAKTPKVVVVGVFDAPSFYGHPAFRFVAPARDLVVQPAPLLHNYFKDLAYLPARQMLLTLARIAPGLTGLRVTFDPAAYARTRADFTSGRFVMEGKTIDMGLTVPSDILARQTIVEQKPTLVERLTRRFLNRGDEQVYLDQIVREAEAHHSRILFVFMPVYHRQGTPADRAWLTAHGTLLENADMAEHADYFENWEHLNHAGAVVLSDRVARAVAQMTPR